jgi:hypothetical protein
MMTSFPSSPAPSNMTRVALGLSGVPIFIVLISLKKISGQDLQDLQD